MLEIKRHINIFVFIFFFLFWFSILLSSGSIFSGYHLADDHEILTMRHELPGQNIVAAMTRWIGQDLDLMHRFKPFYYLHRIIEAKMFGDNFTLWLAYNGFLAVIVSFLLYLFARKIGFSIYESVLFPLLTLVGKQAVVWWSLGPNEAIGMFMLSLSLVCMVRSVISKKGKLLFEAFFIIFSVLMSLSKESFILLIPALIFWKIWLTRDKHLVSWPTALKKNTPTALFLLFVMLVELLVILKWAGVSGYSSTSGGLDGFQPLAYFKNAMKMTFSFSSVGFGFITIAGIFFAVFFQKLKQRHFSMKMKFLKNLYHPFLLFILISGPQWILYAKSGFYDRYLLPMVMGYAVFLIYFIKYLKDFRADFVLQLPRRADIKSVFLTIAFLACSIFFIVKGVSILPNFKELKLLYSNTNNAIPVSLSTIYRTGFLFVLTAITCFFYAGVLIKKKNRSVAIVSVVYSLTVFLVIYKLIFLLGAYEFAWTGKQIKSVLASAKKNTGPQELILMVSDPIRDYEAGFSLLKYLNYAGGRRQIYSFAMLSQGDLGSEKQSVEHYEDLFFGDYKLTNIENKETLGYIIIFPGLHDRFLGLSSGWFKKTDFKREDYGVFVVYYK